MLRTISIVFTKELYEYFRDRRTLVNSLLSALLGPLMLVMLLTVISSTASDTIERPLELPVAGSEHAPNLIAFLEQRNVTIQPAPENPRSAVASGEVDVVLLVEEGFGEELNKGLPAPVSLVIDSSRQSAGRSIDRIETLLGNYSQQLAVLRLQARGVNPNVVLPLTIERIDTATPESRAALLLNVLPYFIIFALFVGGMALAVDSTAGERERGSLEPLLINPAPRAGMLIGKLLSTLVPTAASVIISLIGFAAVINLAPIGANLGVRLSMGWQALVGIFLITLPIALLAAALQMIIATSSKTVKEAQSYLGFLPLIPALPGLFLAFVPLRPALWNMLIPTFGQQLQINQLMRGEAINPLFALLSAGVTIALAGVLIVVAIRLFSAERVLRGA
jgi:sodium transport system permease protein